ncbi:hypothetical protein GCM10010203_60790 [Actinomadura yumaensis]
MIQSARGERRRQPRTKKATEVSRRRALRAPLNQSRQAAADWLGESSAALRAARPPAARPIIPARAAKSIGLVR